MIKKWFSRTTPFVILSLGATIVILYGLLFETDSESVWKFQVIVTSLLFVVALVLVDIILKKFIQKDLWIWLIEVFLSFGIIYYWIIS